jgi:hypothetical protein
VSSRLPIPDRVWTVAAGLCIAVFGFLPIANWIPGGRSWPEYGATVQRWLAGSTIAFGVAALYAIAARRGTTFGGRAALAALCRAWTRRPRAAPLALALAALLVYALAARFVFGGRPLFVDELAQRFQARQFTHGRLAASDDGVPELFSAIHLVTRNGRVFSQFPPGGPAVLAVGLWLGVPWLAVPLCGALAVWCFASFARNVEGDRPDVAVLASVLFAFSPFMVFMSGSQMNHVPALLALCAALLAVERADAAERVGARSVVHALLGGIALGIAATIRPVDAIAFAVPIGAWLAWRAVRVPRTSPLLGAAGVGIAGPLAAMLWFNARTTGAPLLFGYEVLWGKAHGLGFHAAPWGDAHTPARGFELVNLYLLRLQAHLFETPVPSLAASILALGLATSLRRMDRVLLLASALVVALYFAYWHDGFYLGPRFLVGLLPALALWSSRAFAEWRARWGRGVGYRLLVAASVVSAVVALAVEVPRRAHDYADGARVMRWDARAAAGASGVHHAIALVRESWGAQLLARLWAAGLTRSEAEWLYGRTDACTLDRALDGLEHRTGRAGESRESLAHAVLMPLAADSLHVVRSPFSADSTERVLPGTVYGARCVRRVQEDRAGFTVYLPLTIIDDEDVIYARDLHARDSPLLARHPTRSVYLLRPSSELAEAEPRFWRVSRDSLRDAWRREESP